MCECGPDVDAGNYKNQILLWPTASILKIRTTQGLNPELAVDKCIAPEIEYLWSLGIETTGCCCGHNKHNPYIGVEDVFIPKMKELGYKVQHNPMRPGDEDSFWPKALPPMHERKE